MKPDQMFEELKDVATALGVTVRVEKGEFSGGYCVLHSRRQVVINKKYSDEARASVLARSLSHFPLDEIFIKPAVRSFLDAELAKMPKAEVAKQAAAAKESEEVAS